LTDVIEIDEVSVLESESADFWTSVGLVNDVALTRMAD
jgi:hypothetical protein